MTDDELIAIIKPQLVVAAGWEGDEIARDRVDALNYYLQRRRGDEVVGRSTVVAGDVSASVEANLAQISQAFSSDNIIEFDALDPEDEDAAQLETDAVTHFVMKANPGAQQLREAVKDALMIRNGVMKVWVAEFVQTRTKTFDNVQPEAVDELSQGMEIISNSGGTLKVRATRTLQKFKAESLAPENIFYDKHHDSFDIQTITFIAERHVSRRSDLKRMGFNATKVKELKPYNSEFAKADSFSRNPSRMVLPPVASTDPALDLIEWFECYALIDVDNDGIAERRKISFVYNDNVILEDEPTALVPYAFGAVFIMPHRITGISQYDKLRQTQDEHTGLKRALYDNVNTTTKNRLAYLDGKVNSDDVGDGRPNGAIRVHADTGIEDVRAAIMPFSVQDNSASILQNIEALKRERTEMGGAALDMQTNQAIVGGDRMGSQGLDRAFSVMEQLSALMAQNIADTLLRNTFLLAHATLREYYNQPINLKRNGKWESAVPTKWKMRDRITVKVGMSPGERARKAASLMTILTTQIQLAQQGMEGVLVNVEGFYKTMMDWARTVEIQNPEQYYVDPQSDGAKAALQSKTKQAQTDDFMRKQLMTQAVGLEQLKIAVEKYAADADRQYKYWERVLNSDIEEAKIVGKATTDLILAREIPNESKNGSGETSTESASADNS